MFRIRNLFGLVLCCSIARASDISSAAPDSGTGSNSFCLLQRASLSRPLAAEAHKPQAVFRDALLQGAARQVKCTDMQLQLEPSPKMQKLSNIRWVHFPKAGTSLIATIWNYACGQGKPPLDLSVSQNYGPQCGACYDFALMDRYPAGTYCTPGILSEGFVTQHQPVSPELIKSSAWQVVGFFRRPSQRLISAYYNALHANGFTSDENSALKAECADNGPGCFAKYAGVAGCTARMLTGGYCAESESARDEPFDGGKSRLEDAKVSLKSMAFVGITERWDESVCLFHRMFGGRLNSAQLVDMHEGSNHEDHSYDESLLDGFKDEVDELIYKAAEQRFEELLSEHLGATESACGELSQEVGKDEDAEKECSCEARQRECGMVPGGAIDCGTCPPYRLQYSANLTCDQQQGVCLVDGAPNHDVFAWQN